MGGLSFCAAEQRLCPGACRPSGRMSGSGALPWEGDLKACFCLAYRKGDMRPVFGVESYKVFQNAFLQAAEHMEKLCSEWYPERWHAIFIRDMRQPGRRHALRKEESAAVSFPASSCPCGIRDEHGLRRCAIRCFDGTGYGTDGTVLRENFCCVRAVPFSAGHLEETDWLAVMLQQRMPDSPLSAIFIRPDVSFRGKTENDRPEEGSEKRKWSVRMRFQSYQYGKSSSMGSTF